MSLKESIEKIAAQLSHKDLFMSVFERADMLRFYAKNAANNPHDDASIDETIGSLVALAVLSNVVCVRLQIKTDIINAQKEKYAQTMADVSGGAS